MTVEWYVLGQETAVKGPGLHLDRNVGGDDSHAASITDPNFAGSDSSSSDSSDSDLATALTAQRQGKQPNGTSVAATSGEAAPGSTPSPDGVAATQAAPDALPMSAAQQRAAVQNLRQSMGMAGGDMHLLTLLFSLGIQILLKARAMCLLCISVTSARAGCRTGSAEELEALVGSS